MEMQDKEFDQLFNSKLNDFEAEPSAEVWQNITHTLDGKKAKPAILPYLSIAASIVVIASVSIWFFNKPLDKPGAHPVKMVKQTKPVKQQPVTNIDQSPVLISRVEQGVQLKEAATAKVKIKMPLALAKMQAVEQAKQGAAATLPVVITKDTEQILAVVPVQKAPVLQTTVPDNNMPVIAALSADHSVESFEKQAEELSNTSTADKAPAKKRAHGLGGLFNTIIAAVDKREDKLIEFTDASNDEGTRVTGVNLGIFKIKKQ